VKTAQETAVGRLGPAHHASPAPPLAAQAVEPPVIRDSCERVGLDRVAAGTAHLAETRPALEEGGVRGGDCDEGGTTSGGVGCGDSLPQALELVGGLCGKDRLVAWGRGSVPEAAQWKVVERALRPVRCHVAEGNPDQATAVVPPPALVG
jgi:hypothetical protein